jgi:hypothetical protein
MGKLSISTLRVDFETRPQAYGGTSSQGATIRLPQQGSAIG